VSVGFAERTWMTGEVEEQKVETRNIASLLSAFKMGEKKSFKI